MNKDILKGNWKQLKGEVQKQWGKLTDDEVEQAEGDVTKLAGLLQEHYGKTKEEAHREIEGWYDRYSRH
jgi:uncharacterized protein YjbJ (UPF0337 family)